MEIIYRNKLTKQKRHIKQTNADKHTINKLRAVSVICTFRNEVFFYFISSLYNLCITFNFNKRKMYFCLKNKYSNKQKNFFQNKLNSRNFTRFDLSDWSGQIISWKNFNNNILKLINFGFKQNIVMIVTCFTWSCNPFSFISDQVSLCPQLSELLFRKLKFKANFTIQLSKTRYKYAIQMIRITDSVCNEYHSVSHSMCLEK